MLRREIESWIKAGADYSAGLKLYVRMVGKGHPTIYILRKYSVSNHRTLVTALTMRAGIKAKSPEPIKDTSKENKAPEAPNKRKLRDDYSFLDNPNTPNELKILVSNKITAYKEFKAAHEKLFDCRDNKEELATARHIIENYIENYRIHKELHHYKNTGTVLGNHPIFEEFARLKSIATSGPIELMKQMKRLEHNIWRIQRYINSGDKPHLLFERQQKLASYNLELDRIKKQLGEE